MSINYDSDGPLIGVAKRQRRNTRRDMYATAQRYCPYVAYGEYETELRAVYLAGAIDALRSKSEQESFADGPLRTAYIKGYYCREA